MKSIKIFETNDAAGIIKSLLNNALKDIMSLVNAECGSLFLFDEGCKELILNAFYNSSNLHILGLRKKMGEGVAGKVADIKIPTLVKDIRKDSRFQHNGYGHYKTHSFISIPLFTSVGLLGLINVADKSTKEPFSEKDLESAVTISRYACQNIDTFLSYLALKEEKEISDGQKSQLEKYASVGKLAAGIVHEINNPLDGVIRYINIVLGQADENSITLEYLLEAKKGLNRIANITRSLLEFSHQLKSGTSQVKNYIDLHTLLDESLELFQDKLKDIQVEKKYKAAFSKILDFGLAYVIINLIKNALDAMPAKGKLEISTILKDQTVEVNFSDTGSGISSEIKERIFEPFFTTKSAGKGAGLGLAICKEIINKYEGSITAQSSLAQGTTFTILIPEKFLENA